ncbi:hypothetical protein CALCODRAFT_513518 [Calocera cornea HHB12733]|uniref:DUF6532 domain-containing protein n=1 Tax=Calocera cornea HHB12733 TaxID=1353952 RepID=A0A165C0P0_9BASI|nr:hypothetical protein CALCODRAFT_513518 [Calocera cornea HHB12733]
MSLAVGGRTNELAYMKSEHRDEARMGTRHQISQKRRLLSHSKERAPPARRQRRMNPSALLDGHPTTSHEVFTPTDPTDSRVAIHQPTVPAPLNALRPWIIHPPPKDDHKGENLASYHPAMQKVLRLAKRYSRMFFLRDELYPTSRVETMFAEASRDAANQEALRMDPHAPQIDFDIYPGQKALLKRVGTATRSMLKTKALQAIESEYPEAVRLAKRTATLHAAWAEETRKKKKKELESELRDSEIVSQEAFASLRKDAHFIYRDFDCLQLCAKLAAYILSGEDNDTAGAPELFSSIPPRLIAAAVTGLNHGFSCYESGVFVVKRFKGLDPENQGAYEDICQWLHRYQATTPEQYDNMIATVTRDYVARFLRRAAGVSLGSTTHKFNLQL